jgi:hypothetical protein
MAVSALVCITILMGWLWAIGRAFNASLPAERQWRGGWLDAVATYCVGYVALFLATFPWPGSPVPALPFEVLGVLHVGAMCAALILLLWSTRAIVVSRRGRLEMGYGVLVLLLLWLYPIGVWIIHPWAQEANRTRAQPA